MIEHLKRMPIIDIRGNDPISFVLWKVVGDSLGGVLPLIGAMRRFLEDQPDKALLLGAGGVFLMSTRYFVFPHLYGNIKRELEEKRERKDK